ncbi:MAG: class I SAM-dependent methyltransferase [Nitrospiraceae bacterium]
MKDCDYSTVTEQAGDLVSGEALSMLYSRYRYASRFCAGKRVLEVACGPGLGLAYLSKHAALAVGGDYTRSLLVAARRSSRNFMPLVRMDAQSLPLRDGTVDVIVCYEAIYYFSEPDRFVRECRRVLSPNGLLLLCTVNAEWPEFNPSPRSHRYATATALTHMLSLERFSVQLLGAFPVRAESLQDYALSGLKRLAVRLRLIPSTMKGKVLLKRIFLGKLVSLPAAIADGLAPYCEPVPIDAEQPVRDFKIIFAMARLEPSARSPGFS